MLTKEDLTEETKQQPPIMVDVEGWEKSVLIRRLRFSEWHEILTLTQEAGGKSPPLTTIAKIIGTCLAKEDGTRLMSDAEAARYTADSTDPAKLMALFAKCMETISGGSAAIEAAEKN